MKHTCGYRQQGIYILLFGLGLTFSLFCSIRFILITVAVLMILLALILMRC